VTKFCLWVDIWDVITYATFGDDRLRGLGVAGGRMSHFPIDLRRRPYNTLTLLYRASVIHHFKTVNDGTSLAYITVNVQIDLILSELRLYMTLQRVFEVHKQKQLSTPSIY